MSRWHLEIQEVPVLLALCPLQTKLLNSWHREPQTRSHITYISTWIAKVHSSKVLPDPLNPGEKHYRHRYRHHH